ncbi:MAG: HD superfamily phosphohydrolase, partial [Myxococcota bacterium]
MSTLAELDVFGPSVRIPELRDVRLTPRFRTIIDRPEFQRLRRVRQLGPTHLVYPGAMHTRFEHSLGAFGYGQRFVASLLRHPALAASASEDDLLTVLAASLLHDVGHYPFAHNLEALHRR